MPSLPLCQPDGFHLGRLIALQPEIREEDLNEGALSTEDPLLLQTIGNVIRIWSQSRYDFPDDFCEHLEVVSLSRQPLAMLRFDQQIVKRELIRIEEPYNHDAVDNRAWRSNNLFDLVPISTLAFPDQPTEETHEVPGRQELLPCAPCTGSGETTCPVCEGSGKLVCPECKGERRIVCARCEGEGVHLGVRGNYIQCQACRTTGYVRCTRCSNKGEVPCTRCKNGTLRCERCRGAGLMKLRWQLRSQIRTETTWSPQMHEKWPLVLDRVREDLRNVGQSHWEWPTSQSGSLPLEAWVPALLRSPANLLAATEVGQAARQEGDSQRVTGARFTVGSCFLYRVEFRYRRQQELVFIGGLSNRVFTTRNAKNKPTWSFRFRRLLAFLIDQIYGETRLPPVDHAFITGVRQGNTHVSDHLNLVPAAAALMKLTPFVTTVGYTLEVAGRGSLGAKGMMFELEVEADGARQLILRTRCQLGSVSRDNFPRCLAVNHTLSFGRLGLIELPVTGQFALEFTDRRIYSSAQPRQLAQILLTAANELSELLRSWPQAGGGS